MIKKNFSYNKVRRSRFFWSYADIAENYGPRCPWKKNYYEHDFANYCRYVKTFNEIRKTSLHEVEGIHVRGKRKAANIPTSWDDLPNSRVYGRSWKDYTKAPKQYLKNLR